MKLRTPETMAMHLITRTPGKEMVALHEAIRADREMIALACEEEIAKLQVGQQTGGTVLAIHKLRMLIRALRGEGEK